MSTYKPGRDKVQRYDSPEAFEASFDTIPATAPAFWRGYVQDDCDWAGATPSEAHRMMQYGTREFLPRAEAIVEQMKEEELFSHGQRIWETGVVGAFPCVPHAVMDLPDTMYTSVETDMQSTTTPLKIYVQLNYSANITPKQITNRGVAILGLVLAMQAVRPVELNVLSVSDPRGVQEALGSLVRIETSPLDLDRATFMLCHSAFARQLCFAQTARMGNLQRRSAMPWAWGLSPRDDQMSANMRKLCEIEDDALYIPGIFYDDALYLSDPIAWIKQEMAKHKLNAGNEH